MSEHVQNTAEYTLVAGLGESGLAAARFLSRLGEPVLVIDTREQPPGLDRLVQDCPDIPVETATLDPKWLARARRVIVSPGLAADLPLIVEARERGMEVIGELELFARAADAPVLAVTGSNGKSTGVSLTAHLLQAQGFNAPAGGNLGPPALELLDTDADAYVLEVSSFQMETTQSLAPVAAALLNISADHIDRHGSLERYAELKTSLLAMAERAVVNVDDPLVRELAPRSVQAVPFSVRQELTTGWSVVERSGQRWLACDGETLLPSAKLRIRGEAGEANALAALALCQCMGGELNTAIAALPAFEGLPHRRQQLCERLGVAWIDDSKGTNVGASVAAIESESAPLVLIAGGQSKGADFGPLVGAVKGRVRAAVLLGEAAAELERLFDGIIPSYRVADMEQAVVKAAQIAVPGDSVLLSPACASQDMFRDYRHRGQAFASAIEGLAR